MKKNDVVRESVTDFDFAYEASSGQKYVGVFVTGVVVTSEAVPVGTGKLDDVVIDIQPDFEGPANVMMIGDFDSGDMSPEFQKFVMDHSGSMPGPKSEAQQKIAQEALLAALLGFQGKTGVKPVLTHSDQEVVSQEIKDKYLGLAKVFPISLPKSPPKHPQGLGEDFYKFIGIEPTPEQLRFPVNTTIVNPAVMSYGMPGTWSDFNNSFRECLELGQTLTTALDAIKEPTYDLPTLRAKKAELEADMEDLDKRRKQWAELNTTPVPFAYQGNPGTGKTFTAPLAKSDVKVYEITDGTEGMRSKESPKPEVF